MSTIAFPLAVRVLSPPGAGTRGARGPGGCAGRADAATAFGLTILDQIVTFDTGTPGTTISSVDITGLQPAEQALAIDLRPATGQIYVLGSTSRLYVWTR